MNILITGGAGFVGSNLTEKLLKQNHKVISVDNFITSSKDNIEDFQNNPNFEFYEMDVTTPEFKKIFLNPELKINQVYDLACPTGPPNILRLSEEMIDTCSVGTKQVMQVALAHKAKTVITSTAEVYGDPEVFPQTESYNGNVNPTGERSAYEEGKRFKETMVMLFVRKYGLDAKITRLFNCYGPRMLKDLRVHADMIRKVLAGKSPTVNDDGLQTRTFCYVDDTLNGMELVMEKGKAGEVYNIGSDQVVTMKALAEKIIGLINPKINIEFRKNPIQDHKGRLPAIDKIQALGWERKVELEEGTIRMIEYFKQKS